MKVLSLNLIRLSALIEQANEPTQKNKQWSKPSSGHSAIRQVSVFVSFLTKFQSTNAGSSIWQVRCMTTRPLPQISWEHSVMSVHSVHVSTAINFWVCSSRNERLLRLLYQQLHLSTYQESFTGWNNQWCFTLRENINLALGRGFSRMVVRALQSGGSNHAGLFSSSFTSFPTFFTSGVP